MSPACLDKIVQLTVQDIVRQAINLKTVAGPAAQPLAYWVEREYRAWSHKYLFQQELKDAVCARLLMLDLLPAFEPAALQTA
jgi:hypothetical protein